METTEITKAALAEYSYKRGREDERREIAGYVQPETVEITIRARNAEEKLDAIRHVFTFDELRNIAPNLWLVMVEEVGIKFGADSQIMQTLFSSKKP